MQTAIFLTFILHRALSGAQNGAHYGQRRGLAEAAFVVLAMLTVGMCLAVALVAWPELPPWRQAMAAPASLVALVAVLGTEHSFDRRDWRLSDVHFWTWLQQCALGLALLALGVHFSTLLLAVYPALFAQKALVNVLGGNSVWHQGTNDATGRTFHIPLLDIHIRRLVPDMRMRLMLALASVGGYFLMP